MCPIGPHGTDSPLSLAGHSRCPSDSYGLCKLSCCSQALISIGTLVEGICPPADQLQGLTATCMVDQLCRDPPHGAGATSAGLLCPLSSPLECVTCRGNWVVLTIWFEAVHWVCWLWGLLGDAGQVLPLLVFCQGPPSMSYNTIVRWLLLVLGLEVPWRG